MSAPLRVLVIHPCAAWSIADVFDGLTHGLRANGVEVIEYRMDGRIGTVHNWANAMYRRVKKLGREQDVAKPTKADIFYKTSIESVEIALRHQVHAVVVVSAMFFHPDALIMLRRTNIPVAILCTESPYDRQQELKLAKLVATPDAYAGRVVNPVSGVWTNERTSVADFQRENPWSAYLPHAWHPLKHGPGLQPQDMEQPAHDVVFVGTGFTERIEWFKGINWDGIDLGLYGTWDRLGSRSPLRPFVKGGQVDNAVAASLYRRAKINLNFYRKSMGWANHAPRITHAESLNPRAYELAACGCFHLSDHRAEVTEKFGALVPTFSTPAEAEALIRHYLAHDTQRAEIAASLPACVAEDSWVQRARQVIGDLERLVMRHQQAA